MSKEQTIVVRIERSELIRDQHKGNQVILGQRVMRQLREKGVPIIGILSPFAVEHGRLTMTTEEGLDGDEFVYTWTGVPVAPELRTHQLTFKKSLTELVEQYKDDEM